MIITLNLQAKNSFLGVLKAAAIDIGFFTKNKSTRDQMTANYTDFFRAIGQGTYPPMVQAQSASYERNACDELGCCVVGCVLGGQTGLARLQARLAMAMIGKV